MALTLMSCSLLPHTINTASLQPTNQIEINTNTKQLISGTKQQQIADTSISGLIKILEQKYRLYKLEDSPEAKAASQELVKIGKAAVPKLINALRKNRIFLTLGVAETLLKIAENDSSVVPILINRLGDKNLQVRFGAMKALENHLFAPELKKAAQNKNPRIAAGAIYTLGKVADDNSIILPFLNHKNSLIRRSTALSLASTRNKKPLEVFAIVKNALEDEDAFIRVNSASILTLSLGYRKEVSQVIEIGDINKISKILVEGTENKDSLIRFTAVQVLTFI
ncbi:MAG: hypothetical protein AAFS12_17190 [Cyanobacteria bacterium J06632_19]